MFRDYNELIGAVGELVTIHELIIQGFNVAKYGFSSIEDEEMAVVGKNVPAVEDYPLGTSCINFIEGNAVVNDHLKPFDFTEKEINQVASICRNTTPCGMARDGTPPCLIPKWLHDRNAWGKIYHETLTASGPSVPAYDMTNTYHGYDRHHHCFKRLNQVLLRHSGDSLELKSRFLRDNFRVHVYLRNIMYKYDYTGLGKGLCLSQDEIDQMSVMRLFAQESRLSFVRLMYPDIDPIDSKVAQQRLNELNAKSKRLSEERKMLFPYPDREGFDYRYDLMAEKYGVCDVAIEVKTNSSKLKYGQALRLNLLRHFGHEVHLAKVTIHKSDLQSREKVMLPKDYSLEFIDVPEIDLTQHLAEFDSIVNMIFVNSQGYVTSYIEDGCMTEAELKRLSRSDCTTRIDF